MSEPTAFEQFFIQPDGGTESFRQQLQQTVTSLADEMDRQTLPSPSVDAESLDVMIRRMSEFSGAPLDFSALLSQQLPWLVQQSVRVDHPHCCAHLHCPVLIPALAAEVILSTLNQSMDSWDQAPVATHIEQQLVDWLCRLVGYEGEADGSFTSGGTQSNLMGLLLARDAVMAREQGAGYSVQHQGVPADVARYRVLCSEAAHFSIAKSCALLGMGRQAVIPIATDDHGRLCPQALEQELHALKQRGDIPMAVVATAGTTDLGSIDPLQSMARLASVFDCWFHVDAAYGGALLLSGSENLLEGIALADSVTMDFHKMFFQPVSCSAFLVKDRDTLSPLCFHADYLSREGDSEPNLVDKSLSTTRRFDALKMWLSLHHVGLEGFGSMINTLLQLARDTAGLVDDAPQLHLFQLPSLTTVLFTLDDSLIPEGCCPDEFHQRLRRHLLQSGQAVIAETRINKRILLKLTLLNPCATLQDMTRLLTKVVEQAEYLRLQEDHNPVLKSA